MGRPGLGHPAVAAREEPSGSGRGYGWRVIDAAHGLRASEVAERVARGEVNRLPPPNTRTYGQIVRANVLTRFNALLGGMLVLILIVGPLQDALFGFVLVANAAIGIVEEVRAKRTLERLTVLTAPKAHVIRDGEAGVIPVEQVVADEVLEISLGGQVVVDGEVLAAEGLEIDEALLTGESDPVQKAPGDPVRSGSFAVAGSGRYRATAIGSDAYAVKLAAEARRFTLTRSELRAGIDRILVWVTWAIVPTGALLFISQLRSNHGWRQAISGAVAGTVAMVPEGLILLMTIAFAAAVVRLAQRRVLVQELPAVEGLARVDVLCIDKTGTLTEGRLVVTSVSPVDGFGPVEDALAAIAAVDEHPNATLRAIAERFPTAPGDWALTGSVPFSSARKWSAAAFGGRGSWVLGGADVLLGSASPPDGLRAQVAREAEGGTAS